MTSYWKQDIERAVIWWFIIDSELGLYWLEDTDFYFEDNKKVFQAIKKLKEDNKVVDLLTLRNQLDEDWCLDMIWGNLWLVDYTNASVSTAHQEEYINILKKERKRINLIRETNNFMLYLQNTDNPNGEVYNFANRILSENTMSDDNYNTDTDIYNLMSYLDDRKGKEIFWFSWWDNLAFLDRYTKWIQKGRTYRIGAPSNLGKSQLMYWVINNLLKQDAKIAFFTLENDKSFTYSNILANYQGVNSYRIEDWTVQADIDYIKSKDWKLFIIDSCYEINEIFTKCMELKPDVVIIDYIWLVQIKKVKEDDKYTEYSKQVQEFVKKSRVSWLDLSNLPKNQEDEEQIRATWWYYGSSFLRNNTDVGIHLTYYKPFYEWKKQKLQWDDDFEAIFTWISWEEKDIVRNYQVAHLIITKNRIWTAKVETIYKIDFNKWGRYVEATPDELVKWKV